jgi:hypothetical protein
MQEPITINNNTGTKTMSKKFKDLSQAQIDSHNNTLKRFGIDPASVVQSCNTADHPGGMRVGHQHNCTKKIALTSIDDLNDKVGFPCENYQNGSHSDADINYPGPCTIAKGSREELKANMSVQQHADVQQAMTAMVMGDSAKVADYKEAINTLNFSTPLLMAVHAAEDITITADDPLIVVPDEDGKPVAMIYGTVTVKKGGYIQSSVPLILTSQVFTIES